MAERRMISKKITDTDAFLDMPLSTQALYFHFVQNADDDGFVGSPNSIIRKIGANKNDYDLLIVKRFVISFETGICVIKHWRIHNYIQSDRYTPTTYIKEKSTLSLEENKAYTQQENTKCIQNVSIMYTQDSIDKDSIDKNSIDIIPAEKEEKHKYGEYKHILLTDKQLEKLKKDYGEDKTNIAIKFFDEYIQEKGYKCKDHNLAMRRWVFTAIEEKMAKNQNFRGRQQTRGELNSAFQDIDDIKI